MKLRGFFGKRKRLKLPFLLREVQGYSMWPSLRPGQIVIARRSSAHLRIGAVVVARIQGREVIKRVTARRTDGALFLTGDNTLHSTDSRTFGWVSPDAITGQVATRLRVKM